MSDPEVTWVCCPAGVVDGSMRLSVVVVPRLGQGGSLADFTALSDWPARVARDIPWQVELGGGASPREATRVGTEPDSALWRAVFPSTMPVRIFGSAPDRTVAPVVTYPAAEVADTLRSVYAAAAASGPSGRDAVVRAGTLLSPDFDLGPLDVFRDRFAALIEQAHTTLRGRNPEDRGLVEVVATREGTNSPVARAFAMQQASPQESSTQEDIDFHQVLTLLYDHPLLLRHLGLLVDLTMPITDLDGVEVSRLRLSPTTTLPSGVTHMTPWTAVAFDGQSSVFAAAPRDPALASGVWPTDTPEFHLECLDVDGAVRKAVALASTTDLPDAGPVEPPSLRNDGIALVHSGRAAALHARMASATGRRTQVAADGGDVLAAEDLIRGYRVDVWDNVSDSYHSLHARRVRYTVDGFGTLPAGAETFSDEGFLQDSLTGNTELYIHERLVTWRGWSLSVPRPEPVVPQHGRPPPGTDPLAALHTHASYEPQPGTLPRLRFGRTYRFRLRTVDLAGHSLDVDVAPDVSTSELAYLRYEPVAPPTVAPVGDAAVFTPGESLHRLVVRRTSPWEVEDGVALVGGSPSERLLLPPRGSLALAEQHGLLDDAIGSPEPLRRAAVRALLDRGDAELTYPVGEFAPYLPDPQAMGILFMGVPGMPAGQGVPVLFESDTWDRVRPIRLRLAAAGLTDPSAGESPDYDSATRTLTVFMADGASNTVRVSSIPRNHALLALLRDSDERLPEADHNLIGEAAAAGLHSMFTPYAELELVCAVEQPTSATFQSGPVPIRGVSDSTLGLSYSLAVHPPTTASVSLQAQWTEHVDQAAEGSPHEVVRSEEVFTWRLPPDATAVLPVIDGDYFGRHLVDINTDQLLSTRQQFGDTGYREVTYAPVATSRFGDCYPTSMLQTTTGISAKVRVLNSAVPPPPVVHSVVPSQNIWQYIERSDDIPPDTVVPEGLPPEPGWEKSTQIRYGGGIRVYLERPWFVTGAEESLGVVLADPAWTVQPIPGAQDNTWAYNSANPLPQWFSQAGQDPIRRSRGVTPLTRADFLNATQVGDIGCLQDAMVEGGKGGWQLPVTILGHVPLFEESTRLWYADVQVNADKSYMPFFRLAVGRYQPNSLNEELSFSRVSTIDFVQPLPDRTLTVLRHLPEREITVTLWGHTYLSDVPRLAAQVTGRLFTAQAAEADTWRPVEDVAEIELLRDPTDTFWTATATLPEPQPGLLVRLLVVERDIMHAVGTDAGAARIVHVGTIDL